MLEIVDLTNVPLVETTSHTSKGNQLKWRDGNIWYKADHLGYEGASEVIVSHLLRKSALRVPYVRYDPVIIKFKGKMYHGCKSADFLPRDTSIIPLERLFWQYNGQGLAESLSKIKTTTEKIQFFVNGFESITGIKECGKYITAILEVDAMFLNDDRHTNNLAVLRDEETDTFALCPIFDNGAALLSDTTMDYPLNMDVYDCIKHAEAKPFSSSFDEQLEAAEELYGVQLRFLFSPADVQDEINQLRSIYDIKTLKRAENVLRWQMRHYDYLMRRIR